MTGRGLRRAGPYTGELMPLLHVDPASDDAVLDRAADVLRSGGLVAFPTETVYGLGAHAFDEDAVERVFAVKGRPGDNPLIVHLADAAQLPMVAAAVTPLATALAARWWPGPLTLVLDAHPALPPQTTAGLRTVAVRVPGHAVARALIERAGVPVAAPSANRSGRPSPTTAAHVVDDLGGEVDIVIDGGPCQIGVESTVVDARGARPVVLREGSVTREDLAIQREVGAADLAASPGTRHRHYTPTCGVRIAPAGQGAEVAAAEAALGRRVGLVGSTPSPPGVLEIIRATDPEALAANLYDALRTAEGVVDVLVVEAVPEVGIGRAVMDRLRRSAG
jgi:L-threonylcarbamoyladenylate synthase